MHSIMLSALLAAALALPLSSQAATKSKTGATASRKANVDAAQRVAEKVVYHVNDAANARAAMRNVQNHISASPDARIVVVTHGKGIDFLLNDAKDDMGETYQPQVAGLKEKGVDFRVCRNTLAGRKLDDSAVILEATVVPSGVAEIGRLQAREGYVYLKP